MDAEWLLAPVGVKKFEDDVLHRKPLLIKATASRAKDAGALYSLESLYDRAGSKGQPPLRMEADVCASRVPKGGIREFAEADPFSDVSVKGLKKLWADGFTLQCHQPQRFVDGLWRLMADMERRLGCLVGANAYLTPAGCQGLNPHWDDVDVWVLQTVGSKAWRIYPEATNREGAGSDPLAWRPRTSSPDLLDRGALGQPVTHTLHPGDVLYLPRGTPHEAVATAAGGPGGGCGPGGSVHVTLSSFQCWDAADLAVHALRWLADGAQTFGAPHAVGAAAAAARALRSPLPLRSVFAGPGASGVPSSAELAKSVAAALRAAASALEAAPESICGAVDELARDFMQNRLPPPPAAAAPALAAAEAASPAGSGRGPAPGLGDALVPALPPGYVRVAEASPTGPGCVVISCLHNDRGTHMMSDEALARDDEEVDGLDDDEEEEEEEEEGEKGDGDADDGDEDEGGILAFPISFGPALRGLFTTASPAALQGVRVRDLKLGDGPTDADRLGLARSLWLAGLVHTKAAAPAAPSSNAGSTVVGKAKGGKGRAAPAPTPVGGPVFVSLDELGKAASSTTGSSSSASSFGGFPVPKPKAPKKKQSNNAAKGGKGLDGSKPPAAASAATAVTFVSPEELAKLRGLGASGRLGPKPGGHPEPAAAGGGGGKKRKR